MDEQEKKAWSQYRMRLNGVFDAFRFYGQDVFIPGAVEGIIVLTKELIENLQAEGTDF